MAKNQRLPSCKAVTTQLCLSCANRIKSSEARVLPVHSQDEAHRAEGSHEAKHPGERIYMGKRE